MDTVLCKKSELLSEGDMKMQMSRASQSTVQLHLTVSPVLYLLVNSSMFVRTNW